MHKTKKATILQDTILKTIIKLYNRLNNILITPVLLFEYPFFMKFYLVYFNFLQDEKCHQ